MKLRFFMFLSLSLGLLAQSAHAKDPCPENKSPESWYDCTGSVTYKDGSSYTGDWKYGKRHGGGTFIFSDGSVYQGNSKRGEFQGTGKLTYANGNIYEGGWEKDKPDGEGVFLDMKTGMKTTGIWKRGKLSKVTSQDSFSQENMKSSSPASPAVTQTQAPEPQAQSAKREVTRAANTVNSGVSRRTSTNSAVEVSDVNFEAFAKSLLNLTMEGSRMAIYFDFTRSKGIDRDTFTPYANAAVSAIESQASAMGINLFDTTELERIGNFMTMQTGEDYDLDELRKVAAVDLLAVITASADLNNKTQIMAKVVDVNSNAGRIIGVAKPEYVNVKVFYKISFEGSFKLDDAGNQSRRLADYDTYFMAGMGNHPDVKVSTGVSDSATHTAVGGLSVKKEVNFDAETRAEFNTKIQAIKNQEQMLGSGDDNILTKFLGGTGKDLGPIGNIIDQMSSVAAGQNEQQLKQFEDKKLELYVVTARVSGIDRRSNGEIEAVCEASDSITVLASDTEKSALLRKLGSETAECAGQNFIARITGGKTTSLQKDSGGADF